MVLSTKKKQITAVSTGLAVVAIVTGVVIYQVVKNR